MSVSLQLSQVSPPNPSIPPEQNRAAVNYPLTTETWPKQGTVIAYDSETSTTASYNAVAGTSPSRTTPSMTARSSKKLNTGVIVGGVIGGVIGLVAVTILAFLFIKRRRNRRKATFALTPFLDKLPSAGTRHVDISEKKAQMVRERDHRGGRHLEVDAEEPAFQDSTPIATPAEDGTGGLNQVGDDPVQALRYRVDVLTQKLATMEAGMAPPNYSSGAASVVSTPGIRIT
ncbi:hypothetical protein L218DRAFT_999076 [Marasmius fiardii PR-910]|nr:hypothetical protein L218DRAFT_999076 [Marasmius fiardii PR-910]